MDPILFIPAFVFVGVVAYQAGRLRATEPTEEEMYRRLVEARRTRRLERQVETALEEELNREAAR